MTSTTSTTSATDTTSAIRPGHVGVNVVDVDRSTAFYAEALGLDVVLRSDDAGRAFAFLGQRGTPVLTLWQQASGRYSPTQPGLHHVAFQVESIDDVRAAEARLRALGAEFAHEGVVAHAEGADSGGVFFLDPDGTRVEVYAPTGVSGQPAPSGAAPTCGFF
jgi:lactoylglutathione lyase